MALGADASIALADVGPRESCHCAGTSRPMRVLRTSARYQRSACACECMCSQLLREARFFHVHSCPVRPFHPAQTITTIVCLLI